MRLKKFILSMFVSVIPALLTTYFLFKWLLMQSSTSESVGSAGMAYMGLIVPLMFMVGLFTVIFTPLLYYIVSKLNFDDTSPRIDLSLKFQFLLAILIIVAVLEIYYRIIWKSSLFSIIF